MITLQRSHDDDAGFLDRVQWIVSGCIKQYKPAEVYIIRIRDWFDYKWCYFSGKMIGAVPLSKFVDLTLPPFVPNRVVSQDHYDHVADGVYEASDAPPLHIRQPSEANFKRFIRRTTNDGTAIWFSTGSKATGRGSVMVYNVSPDMKFGWHVTFLRKAHWQIEKVTFTSKAVIEGLLNLGSNQTLQPTASRSDA
jgi:hypothetical protein